VIKPKRRAARIAAIFKSGRYRFAFTPPSAGVTSRQELVARVFLDEYLPEVVRQTPLTSRGRFDRE
jgi:hypothetical protein